MQWLQRDMKRGIIIGVTTANTDRRAVRSEGGVWCRRYMICHRGRIRRREKEKRKEKGDNKESRQE